MLGNQEASQSRTQLGKKGVLVMTPVPLGERRSSGMSAVHSTYSDENYVVVEVTVAQLKKGCALGLVLEHLDETGSVTDAEIVSTFLSARAHRLVTTVKACRVRIKWVLAGFRPSSTFSVSFTGMPSRPTAPHAEPNYPESLDVDLTTFHGLRTYMQAMMLDAEAGA